MTHDPLCWFADQTKTPAAAVNDGWPCICDLIARVREDERGNRIYAAYNVMASERANGYAAALRDAVAAVKALEPLLEVEKYDGGYDCCGCGTLYDLYEDAITAIEDLGEQ